MARRGAGGRDHEPPELFTGFGATALAALPDIAVGDVLGSCMFNLLILSMMDAIQPEPISARAHQGHALSIGFGLLLIGIAGLGLIGGARMPALGWVGAHSLVLMTLYLVAMRVIFKHEQHEKLNRLALQERLANIGTNRRSAAKDVYLKRNSYHDGLCLPSGRGASQRLDSCGVNNGTGASHRRSPPW